MILKGVVAKSPIVAGSPPVNLNPDPSFVDGTGWSFSDASNITISGGYLTFASPVAQYQDAHTNVLTSSVSYNVTFDLIITSGACDLFLGANGTPPGNTYYGSTSVDYTNTASGTSFVLRTSESGTVMTIANLVIVAV